MKRIVASLLFVALSACSPAATPGPTATGASAPSASPPPVIVGTPGPTAADGADALVADLVAGGATAKLGSNFLAAPLRGEGVLVCVGTEAVQVYVQKDHEAALAVASTIDPEDPSKIGTSIVTWTGRPRFWLRDRIIVLYSGTDAATDAALRTLLGQPFAESHEPGPPPLPAPDCA
jgi:hypothetical protein